MFTGKIKSGAGFKSVTAPGLQTTQANTPVLETGDPLGEQDVKWWGSLWAGRWGPVSKSNLLGCHLDPRMPV